MTQENKPFGITRDPAPIETGVQKVTKRGNNGNEGWIAVITCTGKKSGDCAKDNEFSGLTAGINEQRRQMNLHRMGR